MGRNSSSKEIVHETFDSHYYNLRFKIRLQNSRASITPSLYVLPCPTKALGGVCESLGVPAVQRPFKPLNVPKKLWCYWDQSTNLDSLPPYPKAVVAAWKLLNPNWSFTVVTASNLKNYVPEHEVRALPRATYPTRTRTNTTLIGHCLAAHKTFPNGRPGSCCRLKNVSIDLTSRAR